MNNVTITVAGKVGSGKSALCGEIEILCKALGLTVEWEGGQEEKNLTHADWTEALEMYKPVVTIAEQIAAPRLPNTAPSTQAVGAPRQVGDDTSSVQISRDGSTHKWGCKCEGCVPSAGSTPDAIPYQVQCKACGHLDYCAAPTAPTTGSAPCVCGIPSDALSVHRQDGPCYRKEASASPAASVLTDVDSWREGAQFALREIAKHDLCFLTQSMMLSAIKLTVEAAEKERDRLTALLAASMSGDKS